MTKDCKRLQKIAKDLQYCTDFIPRNFGFAKLPHFAGKLTISALFVHFYDSFSGFSSDMSSGPDAPPPSSKGLGMLEVESGSLPQAAA
jgi:hypothetical protein